VDTPTDIRVGDAFLIDSNVLIDVMTGANEWLEWSESTLAACLRAGPAYMNPIIYAEVSVRFSDPRELDQLMAPQLKRLPIPYPAAFLAGKAHQAYRSRGGSRAATLPDFFVGAHALVEGLTVVTRDVRRYREAFPDVRLVAP